MGVERPFDHRVAGDKEEITTILGLRPFAQPAFILGGKVWLPPDIHPVTLQDQRLGLAEVDVGDLGRDNRRFDLQQAQFGSVLLLEGG